MVITKTRFFGYQLGSDDLNAGFSMHYGLQSMQFGHPSVPSGSVPRLEFDSPRVCSCNKKAGRHVCLPARSLWWRRGESNSGPRKPPDRHLQAQSLISSRARCAQRHARGTPIGSILARTIPITCAGAFPLNDIGLGSGKLSSATRCN